MAEAEGLTIGSFLVKLGVMEDEGAASKLDEFLSKVHVGFLALDLGIAEVFDHVKDKIEDTVKELYNLGMTAQELNMTPEAVDSFTDITGLLGISAQKSTETLKNLNRSMADTAMGMGRAKKIFEDLGIAVTGADGKLKATSEVLTELQSKMQGLDRGQQLRIMERLGIDPGMIEYFTRDTEGLAKALEEVDEKTHFNVDQAVENAQQLTTSWMGFMAQVRLLGSVFNKVFTGIIVTMMPYLSVAFKKIGDMIGQLREAWLDVTDKLADASHSFATGAGMVLAGIFEWIAATLKILIDVVTTAVKAFFDLPGPLRAIIEIGLAAWILDVTKAWKALSLAWSTSPLGRVIIILLALAAVVALLIDDFETWKQGGNSFFDWGPAVKIFNDVMAVLGRFGITIDKIREEFPKLARDVMAAIAVVMGIKMAFGGAMGAISLATKVVGGVRTAFSLLGTITPIIGAVSKAVMFLGASMWELVANPVGLVITAIVVALIALVAAIYEVWKHWDTITKWLGQAWDWVKDKVKAVWDWIVDAIKKYGMDILYAVAPWLAVIIDHWGEIKAAFGRAWDWIVGQVHGIGDVFTRAKQTISDVWDSVCSFVSSAWDKTIGGIIDGIQKAIGYFKQLMGLQGEDAANGEQNLTGDVKGTLKEGQATDDWGDKKAVTRNGFTISGAPVKTAAANVAAITPSASTMRAGSPGTAAPVSNYSQTTGDTTRTATVNQTNNININQTAAPGGENSAQATAAAVVGAQKRSNSDIIRNLNGGVR